MKYLIPTKKGLRLLKNSQRSILKFHPQADMIVAMAPCSFPKKKRNRLKNKMKQ